MHQAARGPVAFLVVLVAGLGVLWWLGLDGARVVAVAGAVLAGVSLAVAFGRLRSCGPFGAAGGIAMGGLALLAAGLTAHAVLRPVAEKGEWSSCQDNLLSLGRVYVDEVIQRPGSARTQDAEHFAEWARSGELPTEVDLLACPGDPDVLSLDVAERLARLAASEEPGDPALRDLVSYAVRDLRTYPLSVDASDDWVMCDRGGTDGRTPHHRNGMNVVLGDGSVRFFDRDALGLGPDDPIVVGPDSEHPELKKMLLPGQ